MCLSIPAKVISVDQNTAMASVRGAIINVGLHLVEDVKEGDYLLIHAGFALEKISEEEALKTLKLIKELDDLDELDERPGNESAEP